MKQTRSVLQDDNKNIILTDGSREILRVKEITAHMLHCPDSRLQSFERVEGTGASSDIFTALGEQCEIELRLHQENGLVAFGLEGSIKGRENKEGFPFSFTMDHCLEVFLTLDGDSSFEANYQHKAWWIRPAFGTHLSEVPEKTQLLIRKKKDSFEVFLAVCGNTFRSDLAGTADGIRLSLSAFRANEKQIRGVSMIYGCGKNPYEIIRSMINLARKLNDQDFWELSEKRYPEIFENIGWCTWDSLGQDVSEAAILQKMEEFREKGIRIPWILIDDGWSDVDREHLTLRGLDADPERFPNGLAGTIKVLKENYQVSYVGVWQAMKGYWYGIEENSDASRIMASFLTRYGNGELSVKPTEEASFGFWNRWHRELKKKGIDFVKVDGQGSVPTMLHGDTSEETAMRNFYTGLEASVFLNFDGNLINCMGMAPENVWNRGKSAISRASDDYTPTVPGSIVEHTLQNCYNNVYQGDLYVGDWDMFWSDHEEALYSSILRVISGGPVYVSDACGKTRKDVLDRLTRPDGKLLRCDGVARPAIDCLTRNVLGNGEVLKIYNTCKDVLYVACFTWDISGNIVEGENRKKELSGCAAEEETGEKKISGCAVEGRIRKKDIPAMRSGRYLVYDQERHCLGRCDDHTDYIFPMGSRQAKLLELVPEEKDITILGMTNKYIASAGVEAIRRALNTCTVNVNCSGTLAFVSEQEIGPVYLDGEEVPCEKKNGIYTVNVDNNRAKITIKY